MRILFAILLIGLTSCSAEWHLKKVIKKNPLLLQPQVVKLIDTLIIRDSFVFIDSFVAHEIDTITLDNKKSTIVIYKNRDKYIVKTKIKSDTIRIVKYTKLPSTIKYIDKGNCNMYLYCILLLLLMLIYMLYAKKMGNTK